MEGLGAGLGVLEAVRPRESVGSLHFLRRLGVGEMGFVGPHMIRDRVELLLPIPGAGHGCGQLSGRVGERPGSSGHLGSQPPGPAAWRVSSWVAGLGELLVWELGAPLRLTHPFCLAEARTCWSWWLRSGSGTGIRSLCRCPACCPVSGPGGRAKQVCGTRAELGRRRPWLCVRVSYH